jgi:hypothetical protein
MGKFSLAICTAFYEMKAYSPYVVSLMDSIRILEKAGIPYDYFESNGDSYVDRAKNALVDRFLKSDHSHLLMIDSDLAWDVEGFGKLIKAAMSGADVIGGAYPNKNNWDDFGCIPIIKDGYFTGKESDGMRLLSMRGIPGGFIIYSRAAIEQTRPQLNTYIGEDGPILECFRCQVQPNGKRMGEDIYFQKIYQECGGKVYLEPDINFTHYGVKGWEGNYDQYLRRMKNGPDWPTLIERLRGAHPGETAWIIGKGPSLQYLKVSDIGDGPVIALTESIAKVESLGLSNPLYNTQKDTCVDDYPTPPAPKGATLLVHRLESNDRHPDYRPRFVFDCPKDFNLPAHAFSSIVAVEIAKLMGCVKVVFIAHDAVTTGNLETCIPHADGTCQVSGISVESYAVQKGRLLNYLHRTEIPHEFVTSGKE